MRKIVLFLLLAYLGFCLLLFLQQRSLIYYPAHTRVAPERTTLELVNGDVRLRGWRHGAERRHALLYFGGNAEPVQYAAAELAEGQASHAVYALSYRGYGASEGRPSETALVEDALRLYGHVRERHPDGEIAVIGRSLGSGVAAQVAARREVSRLVLVTPFDSLAGLAQSFYPLVPVRWLLLDRYHTGRHLRGFERPVLVVRAGRDEIVPPGATDRLLAALPASTEVLMLPGAGHNDLDRDPRYLATVLEFLSARHGQ